MPALQMLKQYLQRSGLILGQVDDMKAGPAVLAVGAWAAPQAVGGEPDLDRKSVV